MAALSPSAMIPSPDTRAADGKSAPGLGKASVTTQSATTTAASGKAEAFDFTEEGKLSKPQAKEDASAPAKAAELDLFKDQSTKAQEAAAKKSAASAKEVEAAKSKSAKEELKALAALETAKAKAVDTKAVEPKATEKTAPEPAAGWYVQVAATREQGQAGEVVDLCRRQGFQTVIEVASVRDSRYYRVLVGPYDSRELALNAKSETKRKSLSRTEPFLKRIK